MIKTSKTIKVSPPFSLEQLEIDTDKDWATKRIENLGAPTADTHAPRARAGDILSGRFGASRLEWGADKLLKGAGVGADPTPIDVPVEVTELDRILGGLIYG